MRLLDFFDQSAALYPQKPFLIGDDAAISYGHAQRRSYQIANALLNLGVGPGAVAAVYAGNSFAAFECVTGAMRAGALWVPVNPRGSADDVAYALNNTQTEVLFFGAAQADALRAILPLCPHVQRRICIDEARDGAASLDDFIRDAADSPVDIPRSPEDVATLMSSGGTTGAPKGVMMPHRAWATMVAATLELTSCDDPVHLIAAPMTHAAGGSALLMAAMGATNVVLPGFDPENVMRAIERYRVTHLFLPPTAIYRMLAHPRVRDYDYSSLRFFNYAAAPMAPARIVEAIDVFGSVMMTAFGQMETGILNTYFSPDDHMRVLASGDHRRLQSCGRASPYMRVEIMDEHGALLPPEARGEIVVQGDQLMLGYFGNPEETARTQTNGWRRTGDIGFKDKDGWLFLVDRKRDMIITGGFNVFPAEIERVLIGHPAVQDCAVVGSPHEDWGEAVIAVVELKSGSAADAVAIQTWARERLSGVAAPKEFHIWRELPRSPAGKVLRRKVRAHFWQGQERQI